MSIEVLDSYSGVIEVHCGKGDVVYAMGRCDRVQAYNEGLHAGTQ